MSYLHAPDDRGQFWRLLYRPSLLVPKTRFQRARSAAVEEVQHPDPYGSMPE